MTVPEYARHRATRGLAGCSPQAVERAIQSGRLTPLKDDRGRTRLDPEVADIQWATKTDPVKSAAVNGDKPLGPSGPVGATEHGNSSGSEYWQAKTRREIAEASRAEIEMRKAAGDLVHRAAIEDTARRCARAVRDAVMMVPERMAPQLQLNAEQEHALADALRVALDDAANVAASQLRAVLPAVNQGVAV
jgi:hypothetical protein